MVGILLILMIISASTAEPEEVIIPLDDIITVSNITRNVTLHLTIPSILANDMSYYVLDISCYSSMTPLKYHLNSNFFLLDIDNGIHFVYQRFIISNNNSSVVNRSTGGIYFHNTSNISFGVFISGDALYGDFSVSFLLFKLITVEKNNVWSAPLKRNLNVIRMFDQKEFALGANMVQIEVSLFGGDASTVNYVEVRHFGNAAICTTSNEIENNKIKNPHVSNAKYLGNTQFPVTIRFELDGFLQQKIDPDVSENFFEFIISNLADNSGIIVRFDTYFSFDMIFLVYDALIGISVILTCGIMVFSLFRLTRLKIHLYRRRNNFPNIEQNLILNNSFVETKVELPPVNDAEYLIRRETVPEEELCVSCMDYRRCIKFEPCNHVACCDFCSKAILQTSGKCPLCRKEISSTQPIPLLST